MTRIIAWSDCSCFLFLKSLLLPLQRNLLQDGSFIVFVVTQKVDRLVKDRHQTVLISQQHPVREGVFHSWNCGIEKHTAIGEIADGTKQSFLLRHVGRPRVTSRARRGRITIRMCHCIKSSFVNILC